MNRLCDVGEHRVVETFKEVFGDGAPGLVVGIGDDASAWDAGGGRVQVVGCDMLVQGVHFELGWADAEDIGHKALAVNLSDLAAMGARPQAAWLMLSAPPHTGVEFVERLARGMECCAKRHGVVVAGGDTVASAGAISVGVTVSGVAERDGLLLRSGAEPGHLLLVGGKLGAAAAGLEILRGKARPKDKEVTERLIRAQLRPEPQLGLGELLAQTGLAGAVMDLSDGLFVDCGRLCAASGCGAELWADSLPLAPGVECVASQIGRPAADFALAGGEDYVLLFTAEGSAAQMLRKMAAGRPGLESHVVGRVVPGGGVEVTMHGRRIEPPRGFEHFRRAGKES